MNAMEYNKISYEIVAVNDKLGSHYEVAILLHFLRSDHFETGFGDWNRKREISLIINN